MSNPFIGWGCWPTPNLTPSLENRVLYYSGPSPETCSARLNVVEANASPDIVQASPPTSRDYIGRCQMHSIQSSQKKACLRLPCMFREQNSIFLFPSIKINFPLRSYKKEKEWIFAEKLGCKRLRTEVIVYFDWQHIAVFSNFNFSTQKRFGRFQSDLARC